VIDQPLVVSIRPIYVFEKTVCGLTIVLSSVFTCCPTGGDLWHIRLALYRDRAVHTAQCPYYIRPIYLTVFTRSRAAFHDGIPLAVLYRLW